MNKTATFQMMYNDHKKRNIMAIDNTPLSLGILKSIITGGGYSFSSAKSGEKALRLIEAYKPDLLIMGTDMPDMDEYELTEKLNEAGKTIPVIFISNDATKESVIKAHKIGVKDFIRKPVDRKTTLKKIEKLLA